MLETTTNRYLITATLLDSWRYLLINEYSKMEDFLKTLNREKTPTTEAQQEGFEFETWAEQNYNDTLGGVFQVKLSQDFVSQSKTHYLLYGIADCVKGGVIYDYKHTSNYEVGKFVDRCQTSMYLQLVPDATKMIYVIGKDKTNAQLEIDASSPYNLYTETYDKEDVRPIGEIIAEFESWLTTNGLLETYHEKWLAK